jgi:hypothetical protein
VGFLRLASTTPLAPLQQPFSKPLFIPIQLIVLIVVKSFLLFNCFALRISGPTFFIYFRAALCQLLHFLPFFHAHPQNRLFSLLCPAQLSVPRLCFSVLDFITMPSRKYSSKERAKWREAQAARLGEGLAEGSTSAAAAACEQPEVRDFCLQFLPFVSPLLRLRNRSDPEIL